MDDPSCPYCPTAVFSFRSHPQHIPNPALFHDTCATRALSEYEQHDLCPPCKHLRLRHLMRCIHVNKMTMIRFRFSSLPGIGSCPLCRFVYSTERVRSDSFAIDHSVQPLIDLEVENHFWCGSVYANLTKLTFVLETQGLRAGLCIAPSLDGSDKLNATSRRVDNQKRMSCTTLATQFLRSQYK